MVCIYKITSPSNKIYIGQTWNWKRRNSEYKKGGHKNQLNIYRSLSKYGYNNHKIEVLEILNENISQDYLNEREVYYWKYYKNLGFKMLNIREPGSRGKHSELTKDKMSLSATGRKMKEVSKEKLRTYRINPIIMLTLSGDYVREFRNASEVSKFFNLIPSSYVCSVLSGKRKTCKGYRLILKTEYTSEKPDRIVSGNTTTIVQYDMNNKEIKSFLSIKEAELELNIKGANANITACCKGRRNYAYGYKWKYKKI